MGGVNPVRGDVPLSVDGETLTLRLTLGALAEIETALGTEDLQALTRRLGALSAADLMVTLGALLSGGGNPVPAEDLSRARLNLREATRAVASAFAAGLSDSSGGGAQGEAPGKS